MTRAEFTALALAAQADPKPLIEHLCWITTKQLVGQQPLQRLIFNHAQQKVHEAVLRQRQAGLPPRIICLKSRQPGISTLACGYVTATALTHPYADSLIVTHLEKASVSLFKKITFMLEHLPMDLRPKLGSSRREELILDSMGCSDGQVQLRSGITVGTASGGELWRGRTVQTAHLSEFSAFPRPEETLLGVLQCVPLTPQSLVVIESTARGVGNAFHEEWNRAAAGESSFIPIFIGWWEIDEYRMAVPKDFEVTPEERELKMAFGLDNQQLQWRRYILHTQSGGSVDRFNQEYPSDPSVAFLVTGLPAFNLDVLRLMSNEAEQRKHELEQGEMNAEGQFFKMPRGRLKIYRRPEAGCEYTIGVDPASGIAEGDYCAIQVFNREREEQVAVWHGHMKPVPLSHIAAALGHWYNDAILAPELNGGHGFSMVEELKAVQYPRIYVWQRVDKVRHVVTNYFGWETSFRTRPLLIDSMAYAVAERAVGIRDQATIKELMEFQYHDGKKAEGLRYDDLAMAWMIAYRVHLEMPLAKTGIPPRVHYAEDTPKEAPADLLQGISRDAWEAVDKDIARMKTREAASDAMIDMPDPGDDDPSLDFIPDLPW